MQLKQSNFFLKNYPYQIGVHVPGEEYEFTTVSLTKEFKNLERLKTELEDSRETAVLQITKSQTEAQALSVALGYRERKDISEFLKQPNSST